MRERVEVTGKISDMTSRPGEPPDCQTCRSSQVAILSTNAKGISCMNAQTQELTERSQGCMNVGIEGRMVKRVDRGEGSSSSDSKYTHQAILLQMMWYSYSIPCLIFAGTTPRQWQRHRQYAWAGAMIEFITLLVPDWTGVGESASTS